MCVFSLRRRKGGDFFRPVGLLIYVLKSNVKLSDTETGEIGNVSDTAKYRECCLWSGCSPTAAICQDSRFGAIHVSWCGSLPVLLAWAQILSSSQFRTLIFSFGFLVTWSSVAMTCVIRFSPYSSLSLSVGICFFHSRLISTLL